MKLDSKIIDGKRPLTCFDVEEAKAFIGKECYFTNNLREYADLTTVTAKRILGNVEDHFYAEQYSGMYAYCLPCDWVKEQKKYRPYTIEEFCNEGFEIVVFREKNRPSHESHVRYNGYRKYDNVYKVILGNISYTLSDLFEDFEYLDDDGTWKPFGAEEK